MNAGFLLRCVAIAGLLIGVGRPAMAHKTIPYRIEVAHGPVLQLDIPAEWERLKTTESPTFPTLVFGPKTGADFRVLVTPLWCTEVNLERVNQDELERVLRRALARVRGDLREDVALGEFSALHSSGWYVTHLERVAGAREFKYRATGAALSGRFYIHFTVFMSSGKTRLVDDAVRMARSATDEISPYQPPPPNAVRLRWYEWLDANGMSQCAETPLMRGAALPAGDLAKLDATLIDNTAFGLVRQTHRVPILNTRMAAEFPSDGFRLEAMDPRRGWYFFSKGPLGPDLSIEVVPALVPLDSESLAVYLLNRLHIDVENPRIKPRVYTWPERVIVEYTFPEFDRFYRSQGHLVTGTVVDGMSVVFHYSQLRHHTGDHQAFESLVRATKYVQAK